MQDFPVAAAALYGRLRSGLERDGKVIGAMDMLLAAHARFLDAMMVAANTGEFERIPGLRVDDWE